MSLTQLGFNICRSHLLVYVCRLQCLLTSHLNDLSSPLLFILRQTEQGQDNIRCVALKFSFLLYILYQSLASCLTLSSPAMLNGYTSKYSSPQWSNPPFLIFVWLSARVPECQKIKNGGSDQYDPERFGRLILHNQKKMWEWKG